VGFFTLAAVVLVLAGTSCESDSPQKNLLHLTYLQFDQNPDSGWRPVAEREDFMGAARMIELYLEGKEGLEEAEIAYLHFHAGQLWALHGEYEKAINHIDRAHVAAMPAGFPQSFNALVAGTRAFLVGNMEAVRSARDDVKAMSALTMRDSTFLGALEHLSTQEGRTYYEVFVSRPE
jgi:hypothetical protein